MVPLPEAHPNGRDTLSDHCPISARFRLGR
jgi:hypothetical protein